MGWIVAAIVMVGVSAESARLDAADAAMRAGTAHVVCQSSRHGEQHFPTMDEAEAAWEGGYSVVCADAGADALDHVPAGARNT